MEIKLSIDSASCIKCGKCVRVCPSRIIFQESSDQAAFVESSAGCISCGHCMAVCPSASVHHSIFPAGKVHPINYLQYPSAEQVMLLCKSRRSNRAFSSKAIPSESLDLILEAAHRAPTASNMQGVEFTLVTSPEKLRLISEFTIGIFSSSAKKLSNPLLKPLLKVIMSDAYAYLPAFNRLSQEFEKGNDLILRKASAVIFIHTPSTSRFGCEDANLAYQNGSLMAESLGVSQFYTGFVCSAMKQSGGGKLAQELGIEGSIHAGMALGMPSFKYPNFIDKQDIVVRKI